METHKTVDIDKVIASKSPKLYRYLPQFLLKYIKRIAHQDDVNRIIDTYGPENKGVDFAGKLLADQNISYQIINPENLPLSGSHIFVSNHPLGALDGVTLIELIGRRYKSVKFIVNDVLMHLKPLEEVFVPVNKHGRQSVEYVRTINELYESDSQILYFPAGLCSRKTKGIISDPHWKKNFLLKAIKHQRNIVPIYFDAQNSPFFYRLARIRNFLGIKINLEMFYLADELFKKKGSKFTIYIGKAMDYRQFDLKKMNADQWTEWIRKEVYELKK